MELADVEDVFAFELNSPESPVRPFRSPGSISDSCPASSPLLDDGMPFTPKEEPPFGVALPGNSEIDRDIDEAMRATRVEKRKRSFVPIRHSPLLDPLPEVDEVAMDDEVASSSDAAERRSEDELAIAEALTKLPLFVSVALRDSPVSAMSRSFSPSL